jgi:predicted ATPase
LAYSKTVNDLISMLAAGRFDKFLTKIRFPHFRNLSPNTEINFQFPLTLFVGPNGCGKSSTLQSLYGCPRNTTISKYWFSTHVDPIAESATGERHCYIYNYKDSTNEVLKQRAPRADDPNYWETSRPIKKYGMNPSPRDPGIDMAVIYLDFRSILTAFDKYFYFEQPRTRTVQSYLADRSKKLKKVLETGAMFGGTVPENKPVDVLTPEQVKICSRILGKDYEEIKIVEHRFFKNWGKSIFVKNRDFGYSEAFAGSGESAVIILVKELTSAASGSLILLDEPEVSLHPGAQRRLQEFLLKISKEKFHQIIVTTHSHTLASGLPPEAIKLFETTSAGNFLIKEDVPPDEAFFSLGGVVPKETMLAVEDRLTARMVEEVVKLEFGESALEALPVVASPGGSGVMKQDIETILRRGLKDRWRFLFDGDQKPEESLDPGSITQAEIVSSALQEKIKSLARQEIKFSVDGSGGQAVEDQKVELQLEYIDFWNKYVQFLPFDSPEIALWDDNTAKQTLVLSSFDQATIDGTMRLIETLNPKQKFEELAKKINGVSDRNRILGIQEAFLRRWINTKPESYTQFLIQLKKIYRSENP